jgi:clan AA aspartic protease
MILGEVNAKLEPVIPLTLVAADGRNFQMSAVVDTGFAAFLSLPPSISSEMRFKPLAIGQLVLADGVEVASQLYAAAILWDGEIRKVEADTLPKETLVGMSLLKGHKFCAAVEAGGRVTIERLTTSEEKAMTV